MENKKAETAGHGGLPTGLILGFLGGKKWDEKSLVMNMPARCIGSRPLASHSGAQRARQQLQRQTVQHCAIECVSHGQMAAVASEQKPNENQGETLVSPEKTQVRVLGLEPRTHGLKVRCSTD